METSSTASAINEVAQRLGLVGFGISALFAFAIWRARTASRRRLLLRMNVAVLAILTLCFVPAFLRAGYRVIDVGFMLGASVLIFALFLRCTTFCDSCTRAITNHHPWKRLRQCPRCGADVRALNPAPSSARAG